VTPQTRNAGVIVRPPLLYGAALIAALALRWFWPMPIVDHRVALLFGLVLLSLGAAIIVPGIRALHAAGTSVDPLRPTTAIVTSGPFRFSRNPLYLGLTLVYSGVTLLFDTWWGMLLLVPVMVVMHRGVVLREEQYLEATFGESYRRYLSTVRRYL